MGLLRNSATFTLRNLLPYFLGTTESWVLERIERIHRCYRSLEIRQLTSIARSSRLTKKNKKTKKKKDRWNIFTRSHLHDPHPHRDYALKFPPVTVNITYDNIKTRHHQIFFFQKPSTNITIRHAVFIRPEWAEPIRTTFFGFWFGYSFQFGLIR